MLNKSEFFAVSFFDVGSKEQRKLSAAQSERKKKYNKGYNKGMYDRKHNLKPLYAYVKCDKQTNARKKGYISAYYKVKSDTDDSDDSNADGSGEDDKQNESHEGETNETVHESTLHAPQEIEAPASTHQTVAAATITSGTATVTSRSTEVDCYVKLMICGHKMFMCAQTALQSCHVDQKIVNCAEIMNLLCDTLAPETKSITKESCLFSLFSDAAPPNTQHDVDDMQFPPEAVQYKIAAQSQHEIVAQSDKVKLAMIKANIDETSNFLVETLHPDDENVPHNDDNLIEEVMDDEEFAEEECESTTLIKDENKVSDDQVYVINQLILPPPQKYFCTDANVIAENATDANDTDADATVASDASGTALQQQQQQREKTDLCDPMLFASQVSIQTSSSPLYATSDALDMFENLPVNYKEFLNE